MTEDVGPIRDQFVLDALDEAKDKYDVDGLLVDRLVRLGMAHESPGDSGPGTVRNRVTGQVFRLTEDGMNRMEDPTWRAATMLDAMHADKRAELEENSANVARLRRIERALKQHQDLINDGADQETAGKIALAGLGFEDYQGARPASEVLAKITASYTITNKWPTYVNYFGDNDVMQIIAPGSNRPLDGSDLADDMERNPVVAEDGQEVWRDNGDGTFIAKREDGSEVIMDTAGGMGRSDLEAALQGRMPLDKLREASPAAALTLGPMIAHNTLSKASEDNPLWGREVVDLLLAAGHLNPRNDEDEAMIDMLLQHHVELINYDTSPAKDDTFRLTRAGAIASEEILRATFNLPALPERHVRALSITADGVVRLVALDASDPRVLYGRVREFIDGSLEEVFCFHPGGRLKGSGRPDAVMFVDEDGLAKGLPTNFKATVMAGELGVEYADIGRGLVGDVILIGRITGADDEEFARELPHRFLEWSEKNNAVNSIAGVKECTTTVLRKLSRNTALAGLDYVLDPRLDPLLDPGGIHVLRSLATLDHLNGLPTEPYLRCELIAKIRGVHPTHAVAQHHFDVRLRDYVALRTPPGAEPVGSMRGLRQDVRAASLTADERTPKT